MVAEANDKSPIILVVDDDREIVRAIAINLEREGYSVLCAYDGTEALELIAENDVKLIILDIMMPRLDGLSVLMKMREGNNIPVILLSAKSEDTDKILGLSIGADDYVTKPFNPDELVARVRATSDICVLEILTLPATKILSPLVTLNWISQIVKQEPMVSLCTLLPPNTKYSNCY